MAARPGRPLLAPVLGLVVAVGLSACGQPTTAADHITRARAHIEQGDGAAALIEARNAVQAAPDSPAARTLLAELLLEAGDAAGAAANLDRAVRAGAAPETLRLLRARALIGQGQVDALLAQFGDRPLPEDAKDAAELNTHIGYALLTRGRLPEATAAFQAAAARPQARVGLVRTALAGGDVPLAWERAAEAQRRHPDNAEILTVVGETALAARDTVRAAASFREALALAPGRIDARFGLARALLLNGEPAEAMRILDDGGERLAEFPEVRLARAVAAAGMEDWQMARQSAETVLSMGAENAGARLIAGLSNLKLGAVEKAHDHLGVFLRSHPDHIEGRTLLALAQARLGSRERAVATLGDAPEAQLRNADYLSRIGAFALELGQHDKARDVLAKAASAADSQEAEARVYLARTAVERGSASVSDLARDIQDRPELMTEAPQIALALLLSGRHTEALTAARALREKDPADMSARLLEALALLGTNQPGPAEQALRDAHRLAPENVDFVNVLAQLLAATKRAEEAEALLRPAFLAHPDDRRLLTAVTKLAQADADRARGLLETALEAHPAALGPRLLFAEFHLDRGNPDAALALLSGVPADKADEAAVLDVGGRAYLSRRDTAKGLAALEKAIRLHADAVQPRVSLGRAHIAGNRPADAVAPLREALKLAPDTIQVRVMLAGALALSGEGEAATAEVQRIEDRGGRTADTAEIRGIILARSGRGAESLEQFRMAYALEPVWERARQLSGAEWAAGQRGAALKTLQGWADRNPAHLPGRFDLAVGRMIDGDLDGARKDLETAVTLAPDNAAVLNNLAHVLWRSGRLDDAAVRAEAALRLVPEDPAVKDTLGVILLDRGETGRALDLLTDAATALPDNAGVQVNYARALAKAGRGAEARKRLKALLDGTPQFDGRDDAAALLASLR